MLGLPEPDDPVEFHTTCGGTSVPAPSRAILLVFYILDDAAVEQIASRFSALRYECVEAGNAYWNEWGVTIEDPRRLASCNREFIGDRTT